MILTEYNEELHIKSEKQISFEEGEKVGIARGEKIGEARGESRGQKIGLIETYQELNKSQEETVKKLVEKFSMTEKEARECLAKYWKA